MTAISVYKTAKKNEATELSATSFFTACTATGVSIPIGKDDKTVIILYNDGTSPANVTIEKGDGLQGVNNLAVTLTGGKYYVLSIDSGAFKHLTGTEKGNVVVKGVCKIAVVEAI